MRTSAPTLLAVAALVAGLAHAQSYNYDADGRLVRVAYPGGGGVMYEYDAADNMTSVVPLSLPAAPSEVEVTRLSPSSARISWQSSPSATGYVIERSRAGSDVWEEVATVPAGSTTFIDPGLQEGVDYSYRVSAVSADGRSAPSTEVALGGPLVPAISQNGVVNGASFAAGVAIAPGSIVSIFGDNIGVRNGASGPEAFSQGATTVPLPRSLGGYKVLFNGVEAPLFFVGGQPAAGLSAGSGVKQTISGQINAQAPWEIEPGVVEVSLVRESDGQVVASQPMNVSAAAVSPALFTFDFGPGRAAAINVKVDENDGVINGSIAQPAGAFPGIVSQPAQRGGVVTLFANGLGPVDPEAVTGNNSLDAVRATTVAVRVFVGEAEAQVLFSGLAPEFVGLYQINIVTPLAAVPGDAVPIRIEQGGVMSRPDVTIAVQP